MYIWSDTKKLCNPFMSYTAEDGTFYSKVPEHLYEEIPEDPIPDPEHPEHYFRSEDWEATERPYIVYTLKSPEQIRQMELSKMSPVSPRQLRQALTFFQLRAQVETLVSQADQDTKDWYEYATEFEREHPQLVAVCDLLGLTEEQVDQVFQHAITL